MLMRCRRSTAPAKSPSKSIRIARIVSSALLSVSLACSRPPQNEPVTLTFLDIEWDMSVRPLAAKSGGRGIGLFVSRSIVDRDQGRLWAEPNDGPGATFSFSVPCGQGEVGDAARALRTA